MRFSWASSLRCIKDSLENKKNPASQAGPILVSPLKVKQVIEVPNVVFSSRSQFNEHSTCTVDMGIRRRTKKKARRMRPGLTRINAPEMQMTERRQVSVNATTVPYFMHRFRGLVCAKQSTQNSEIHGQSGFSSFRRGTLHRASVTHHVTPFGT